MSGNPFGVSVGTQGYTYLETNTCTRPSTKTTSSNTYTIPVITLYSSNNVNVGGATIGVGANPTAVVAYNSNPVTTTTTSGCISVKQSYSGSTRAIVANSGGNTVSILDIVNNKLLSTVTVGNHPVALAVSSDGKTAYVANNADSTIAQVALNTNTVTSTVAVGGPPTSVTLTAGGTLWVGGAGFLTQINTTTMSVTGTETAQVKNIVALSYSDQLGQLIVESTDSTGALYEDEMGATTFTAGGTYSALASHNVSTLGTYTVGSIQVRAYTSMLSGSSSLPIDLPGAPPLVVQDGWAVITATPTGFTITDADGHNVLISQTTASPVAGIAVDTNLSVAYLTEPDANIILQVPLPGTAPLN
jgi:YVTN family beta-propeller protein